MNTLDERLFPSMQAVLGREITDVELHTFDYVDVDNDEPDTYLNHLRAERMLLECTASELRCFINAGLLDLAGDCMMDPEGATHDITLLELVIPDVDKMEVCIAACLDVDASDDIAHKTTLDNFQLCYCNDMVGRYLACGGNDIRGVDLLLGTSEYNFIQDNHMACARSNGIEVRHPELFEHLQEASWDEYHYDQCVRYVAEIRCNHKAARARARLCVVVCCAKLKVLALRARECVLAPGSGAEFRMLQDSAVRSGMQA